MAELSSNGLFSRLLRANKTPAIADSQSRQSFDVLLWN